MRGASRSPKALQKRGLNNQLADAAVIFLYRGETRGWPSDWASIAPVVFLYSRPKHGFDLSGAYCSGYRHRCRKYRSSYATATAVEWATKEPLTTRPPAESL
jgi:hypothetical protein